MYCCFCLTSVVPSNEPCSCLPCCVDKDNHQVSVCLKPDSIASLIKSRAGHSKYRGFLNYYYGVIVEEALQTVVEQEIQKRNISRSAKYISNDRDQVFVNIYGQCIEDLLNKYKFTTGAKHRKGLSLMQHREFTYWLFKFRVRNSDKAKVASDTTKGLNYLERINNTEINSRVNSVA